MAVSPAGPGSSGNAQRIGWVAENTHRPPGRSTRATSRIAAAEFADERDRAERGEGDVERRIREGQFADVGQHQRHRHTGPVRRVTRVREHPGRQIERDHGGARIRQVAGAGRRSAADLEDAEPGDVTEQMDVGLAQVLRAPDQVDVAQERTVLGVVGGRVGIPPPPVGCPGNLLIRRAFARPGRSDRRDGRGTVRRLGRRHGTMVAPCVDPLSHPVRTAVAPCAQPPINNARITAQPRKTVPNGRSPGVYPFGW